MRQHVELENYLDAAHNPAGGWVHGTGIDIEWQNGPLGSGEDRAQPNGAFVEDVIAACAERIRFYQEGPIEGGSGKFACRENALARTHLEEALHWLDHRTRQRQERGVEGTHAL